MIIANRDRGALNNESIRKNSSSHSNQPPGDISATQINEVDLAAFEGQEVPLVQQYLDCDLLNKDLSESKNARNTLGIGMPEVRAIHKRMKLPN